MVAPNDETVEYNLLLNAKQALASLKEFNSAVQNSGDTLEALQIRANNLSKVIQMSAEKAGVSFEHMQAQIEKLNESIGGGSLLGREAGIVQQKEHNEAVIDGAKAQQELADKTKKAGDNAKKGAEEATYATRAWNIAVGMLIHQGINLLITSIQTMVTTAIEGLKSLEVSVYNVANAERAMSQSGIDVTFKDLESVVDRLSTKFKGLFSKVQLQDVVADIAIATKELGLDAAQIEKIAASAAALQLRNPGKTVQEVNQQLLTAILSGQTKGIRSLGVAASEAAIQQQALAMGLIKVGETANAQQKSLATLELVYKATAGDAKNLEQYQNTLTGVQQELKASWQDLLSEIAKTYAPEIIQGFKLLVNILQLTLVVFKALEPAIQKVVTLMASLVAATKGLGGLNPLSALQKFIKQFADAKKGYEDYFASFNNSPDTPTGMKGIDPEATAKKTEMLKEQEDKLTEIFKDARDKREDIDRNYNEKLVDIALNYQQKLEDIARTTAQKTADAQRDYAGKVADINRDTEQKKVEAQQEAHKKAIDAEKQYQDELKKLREKYLMDLEEALHERDARQILRLMRQYEIDKNNAKKQKENEQKQAKDELSEKLKQIEIDRKLKLEAAQRDLADKLRDIQLAAARERQEANINRQRQLNDARIAHQRALEEQRIYLQRKLRDLADALAKEYNMTATGLSAMNGLFNAFSGSVANASSPANINAGTYVPSSNAQSTVSSTWANAGMYGTGGMAEGGTFLATRPQTINVGENRPEVITATPLGKPGRDISKVFANGGVGGMGGQIEIAMTLSPDLEARITRNTLDETANIVTRLNRSK